MIAAGVRDFQVMLDELGMLQTNLPRDAPAPDEPPPRRLGCRVGATVGVRVLRDGRHGDTSGEVRRWQVWVGVMGARRDEEWAPPV